MSFETLGLGPNLLRSIGEVGYSNPTPIQEAAIPLIIDGKDLIGIAQTGTGKTAAFTLPMLETLERLTSDPSRRGKTRALVLSPTRELVVQIHDNVSAYAKHLPLKVANIYGGVNEAPQKKALRQGVDLVIATPGRLMDLMGQGCADFSGLEYFVLDEADRMLDMGFLPNIRKIVKDLPKKGRQTLLFSATLSRDIEKLTKEFLYRPETVEIGRRTNPADTVKQCIHEVPKSAKISLLKHLLQDNDLYSVLVFTRTKHGADRVAKQLGKAKIPSAAIHSNRTQNQRARALQDFKDGKTRVLVATDIAARGIDVEGITHVINFDFPPHAEDYVHRIGRTGRANQQGEAISFITSEDQGPLRLLERKIKKSIYRKKVVGFNPAQESAPQRQPHPRNPQKREGGGERPFRTHKPGGFNRSSGGGNSNRRRTGQHRGGR
jgi:ATP-dependent RNA helicase RhlE